MAKEIERTEMLDDNAIFEDCPDTGKTRWRMYLLRLGGRSDESLSEKQTESSLLERPIRGTHCERHCQRLEGGQMNRYLASNLFWRSHESLPPGNGLSIFCGSCYGTFVRNGAVFSLLIHVHGLSIARMMFSSPLHWWHHFEITESM